jgi:hypothetical protein
LIGDGGLNYRLSGRVHAEFSALIRRSPPLLLVEGNDTLMKSLSMKADRGCSATIRLKPSFDWIRRDAADIKRHKGDL